MTRVLSLNIGRPKPNPAKKLGMTGIDKQPVAEAVAVSAPGPVKGVSGLAGDPIGDAANHGGNDQAVYAYAKEDLVWWAAELGRELPPGHFGENLTTEGLAVNDAMIGEIWRIGDDVELQATFGRIPCATFQARMSEPRWVKRFARANRTGAYLRVLTPGEVRAGDPITVIHRSASSVTIAEAFEIYMFDHSRLARLLDAEALPADLRREVEEQVATR
jgi:MOSC domain-containing protein YiiM